MQITELNIKKLYGYIDKKIHFHNDMNLLVGINGAGKTSVLNVLTWLLRPSIKSLIITDFESLDLKFRFNDANYIISCRRDLKGLIYSIESGSGIQYEPLRISVPYSSKEVFNNEDYKKHLLNEYRFLRPEEHEKLTWEFVESLPTPTIIGLDRNLYVEETREPLYFTNKADDRFKSNPENRTPLDRVKQMVNMNYRRRKNSILRLTNQLKNSLMISAFEGNITQDSLHNIDTSTLSIKDINKAELKLQEYFNNLERKTLSDAEHEKITLYFKNLKQVVVDYEKDKSDEIAKIIYKLNRSQFSKVSDLLNQFEKFETQTHRVMMVIDEYLKAINFFLKDSAKEIVFKEETSEIGFNTLDKNGKVLVKNRDITSLSSGEQQILILFSYIAFNSKNKQIFIIDEPELSLHIKWQENFLEKLDSIRPLNTQIIIATHSPILASKRKEKAIVLLPYNEDL